MSRGLERVTDALGWLGAWLFFAVGGMITYEVVMRYLFNAPTIWAEELSRFFQLWATYLAAAFVLRHRRLIAITVLVHQLTGRARQVADSLSLVFIGVFSVYAIVYGVQIALESVRIGRATSTMLTVPQWTTEVAIPVGFALLLAQAAVELVRVWRGEALERASKQEHSG